MRKKTTDVMTEDVSETEEKKTFKEKGLSVLYDVVSVFFVSVLIMGLLFTFFVRIVGVVGESMEPTLYTNDFVFISQIGDYKPRYGDIVVVSQPNDYNRTIVKRIIATEGQTIDIDFDEGIVYIDGSEVIEPYIKNETTNHYDMQFPVTIPEGYCFVMGDNRQGSIDSRSTTIGLIHEDYIMGKAVYALTDNGYKSLDLFISNLRK